MNTHVEYRTRFALFSRLTAMMSAKFKAWRAQQIERLEIEALEALGPELLDDIGVRIVKVGKPPKSIAVCNPYAISVAALSKSQSAEHSEY
jgi:uncharacterized protein YjiS (DUF1127 family)